MSQWYTPAPPGTDLGPLPRRSAAGLALQFALQWLYLVPLIVIYELGRFVTVEECVAEGDTRKHVLTPSRYRLEREGTRQEWEAWADRAIERGTGVSLANEQARRAENARGTNRYKHKERVPTSFVKRRYYRGIGAGGVAALAARRGWDVDWKASALTKKEIHLVYRGPFT